MGLDPFSWAVLGISALSTGATAASALTQPKKPTPPPVKAERNLDDVLGGARGFGNYTKNAGGAGGLMAPAPTAKSGKKSNLGME